MTKKKLIIFISIGLVAVLLISALIVWFVIAGANGDVHGVGDNTIHYIEGTLHKVNVEESDVEFVKNGKTDYKIYADLSNKDLQKSVNKIATFIKEQVYSATGAEMEIINSAPQNLSDSTKAIVIGFKDVFASANLVMPKDDISTTGYYIKTKGNSVFIEANGGDGYRLGGLAFLREVLGYDMISEDCVVYSRKGETLPKMDIVERPDFDYRQISNFYTQNEVYGMGMHTHTDLWIPINGWDMHNSLYYIPPEIYGAEHPEWYRADMAQPCYTAHGVKDEYESMLLTVFEVIKTRMEECPEIENISFTAMDGTGEDSCSCETCLEYRKLYGTPAATCIYFMNDLNELVQHYIALSANPDRILNLVFFAYHDSEPAPVERVKFTDSMGKVTWGEAIANERGEFTPLRKYAQEVVDGKIVFKKDASGNYVYEQDDLGNYSYLICDDHVYPWLAPIYSKFTSSFYDKDNASYAQNVKLWYTVSSNVYLWIYGTNFVYYLFPYNNWSCKVETYRYLKDCGVKYLWEQAQERNQSTAFTDLKDYIDSKFMFDVNADLGEVINDYFDNYYLDASTHMRQLFNLIQAQSDYLEETVPIITGGIYDEIGRAEYWPRLLLEQMLGMIDSAYKAVEKYKTANPTLYTNLVKRIKKESIFPRYVICMYYGDYYSNIKEMRASFKNDWNELGFSVYKEHDGDMQPIFAGWGV